MQGLVNICLETSAVDLTGVHSPAIFNERSMQLGLSTGVAAELETAWNLETKSRMRKCSIALRTAKPKILIANPPCPLSLKSHNNNNMEESTSWSPQRTKSSQHDLISHLLCARALDRCIVVISSSSNIRRTRRPGMSYVLTSLLYDQVIPVSGAWRR